jgi:predicted GNAT family acetyltransferase
MLPMTDTFTVEREDGPARGRYVIYLPEGLEAEMTYGRNGDGVIVADHTFVPPEHRGKGIAEQLIARVMEDARREAFKIVPQCSYVAAQFRRHPEWADLRA